MSLAPGMRAYLAQHFVEVLLCAGAVQVQVQRTGATSQSEERSSGSCCESRDGSTSRSSI